MHQFGASPNASGVNSAKVNWMIESSLPTRTPTFQNGVLLRLVIIRAIRLLASRFGRRDRVQLGTHVLRPADILESVFGERHADLAGVSPLLRVPHGRTTFSLLYELDLWRLSDRTIDNRSIREQTLQPRFGVARVHTGRQNLEH